jgi:hypothetical protein
MKRQQLIEWLVAIYSSNGVLRSRTNKELKKLKTKYVNNSFNKWPNELNKSLFK